MAPVRAREHTGSRRAAWKPPALDPTAATLAINRGNANGRVTREAIMRTAEQLFAERGIDAVALREIGQAAGQRNNNAVQYHFGDRPGLVGAIYAYRSEALNRRRLELLVELDAAGAATDAHDLVGALLQPHAESVADPDNHFVRLLARLLLDHGTIAPEGANYAAPFMSAYYEIRERVRISLPAVRRAVFDRRFGLMFDLAIAALASHSASHPADGPDMDAVLDELVGIFIAGLGAPAR